MLQFRNLVFLRRFSGVGSNPSKTQNKDFGVSPPKKKSDRVGFDVPLRCLFTCLKNWRAPHNARELGKLPSTVYIIYTVDFGSHHRRDTCRYFCPSGLVVKLQWDLSDIWEIFELELSEIWTRFERDLSEIWEWFKKHLIVIWARFERDLSQFRDRYDRDLREIWERVEREMSEICERFQRDLNEIW
jgi:hypothetical protein